MRQTYAPDPRWGMLAPMEATTTYTSPGGVKTVIAHARTVSLAVPGDPFSMTTLTDTFDVDGRVFTSTYDAATRTTTRATPEGRVTKTTWDAAGHGVGFEKVGIDPFTFAYDGAGKLRQVTQGERRSAITYDANGNLATVTNPAGQTIGYDYNAAGLLDSMMLPSGATYRYGYSSAGDPVSVTMPGGVQHSVSYTDAGAPADYLAPDGGVTRSSYDLDGARTSFALPSGRSLHVQRDASGRVTSVGDATDSVDYTYVADDRLAGVTRSHLGADAQALAFAYDGDLLTQMRATGLADETWRYRYGTGMRLVGITTGSNPEVPLTYDGDGLLASIGSFTITRDQVGLETKLSDGVGETHYAYDSAGQLSSIVLQVGGTEAYRCDIVRDEANRIVRKTETINGTQRVLEYAYDVDGRLAEVRTDSAATEAYGYDARGNRTSFQVAGQAPMSATYDDADRLKTQGDDVFEHSIDGVLMKRNSDTFSYGPFGELLSAQVAGGEIVYRYDGLGRRVLRRDASGEYKFLYGYPAAPWRVTAAIDPAGVRSDYVYDARGTLCAFVREGETYYVAVDQLGSPTSVVDAGGAIVKSLVYDAWGNVLADSAPGFDLPFGFAGGVVDQATGFVHFGLRDYDPADRTLHVQGSGGVPQRRDQSLRLLWKRPRQQHRPQRPRLGEYAGDGRERH